MAAAWGGGGDTSSSSDGGSERGGGATKAADGRMPEKLVEPTLRTAGAKRPPERPKEPPRTGGDPETGGGKALKRHGAGLIDLSRNWWWAAEHTCELRAWRGRPLAHPHRRPWPRARPPADTVFPRSEHHAHMRSARGGPASAGRRHEGRAASIRREQRGKHPTPARVHTQAEETET